MSIQLGFGWDSGANPMKMLLRTALLLGMGFVSGVALTLLSLDESGQWSGNGELEAGSALFDAEPSEVRFLTYHSESMAFTAQRSSPDALFTVQVTHAGSDATEHCVATHDLGGVLATLARAKVRTPIAEKERGTRYPVSLGYIEVKDAVYGEPISPWLLFESKDGSTIAIEKQSRTYETDVPPEIVKKLSGGCATLSAR